VLKSPGLQRLFRRLGLIPGPTFDVYAAAALDGASLGEARRQLDELYDQHLLTEPALGRHQLHDLLREHAPTSTAATTAKAWIACVRPSRSTSASGHRQLNTSGNPPRPKLAESTDDPIRAS
jgi:hypothetical protein